MQPHDAPRPWYKQFWPWFLLALPATAVTASLYTVYLAATNPVALVVDDYAKIGLATQKMFEREQRARDLALTASLEVGPGEAPQLAVALTGRLDPPPVLVLTLSHPTVPALDQRVDLLPRDGRYTGTLPRRQPRYYLQLEPADRSWRLDGEMHSNSTRITLAPRAAD